MSTIAPIAHRRDPRRRPPAGGAPHRRGRPRPARLARPGRRRRGRGTAARPARRPRRGHVHRRPQRQLHQLLHHRLRLLRLLPPPDGPRGLRPAQVGHLPQDRGDARPRRHGAAAAGGPPPEPAHRVVRGPLHRHQVALPDPPARPVAVGDPAHRPRLADLARRDAGAPARRGPRLAAGRRRRDPGRPRAPGDRAAQDHQPTSGST